MVFTSIILFSNFTLIEGARTSIKVAVNHNFPPFQYLNNNGEIVGLHIDIMNEIAKNEKLIVEYIAFNETHKSIEALENGIVDCVLGIVSNNYKNDSLKLKATKFLITNMMGSFSKNGEIIKICTPFYEEYDSLANLYEYEMDAERGKKIDSLWSQFSFKNHQLHNLPYQLDLENISAEQLIAEN